MSQILKTQKKQYNRSRESIIAKLFNLKDDFNFDDIIPYEDVDYNDQYDDVIVGGITKFDDDFYKDDTIYYYD
ncbi:MAG: hypothetical protein ACRC92_22525 [Peptostreptococcaceae bacterium]